jgi:hypothetical protein
MKEEDESAFDSYYHPASSSVPLDVDEEWFTLDSFSNTSTANIAGEQWIFAMLSVADGAAGGFLSINVKTSPKVQAELYARHEGCPSNSVWDFKAPKEDSQRLSDVGRVSQGPGEDMEGSQTLTASKFKILNLAVIYPSEGYWCVGLKYTPQVASTRASVLHIFQDLDTNGSEEPVNNRIHDMNASSSDDLDGPYGNLASSTGEILEVLIEFRGCPKKCSGHGTCKTVYEASRLHVIRYFPYQFS